MPVFRNVGHAGIRSLPDRGLRDVFSAERDGARGRLLESGQAVDQFRLTVSVDSGDTQDLSRVHFEGNVADSIVLVDLGRNSQAFDLQDRLARNSLFLLKLQLDRSSDHHVGKFLFIRFFCINGTDVFPLAQHGDPVRNRHDLVELMSDEQDGFAFTRKPAHDLHQFIDLLRRKNSGRLVEDEDLIVPVQHLEDLDALLHTDRDVFHLGIHVHLEAVLLRQRQDLLSRFLLLQEAERAGRLRAEDDVVQHGKNIDQLEMLMHHADSQRGRVVRIVDPDDLAVFTDLPCFRLIEAEQDTHQRRLARSVLAEKRVDLALPELKRDVVICHDPGELLADVVHFDNVF